MAGTVGNVTRLSPLTRAARQARLADLLTTHEVRSQAELGALLSAEGVQVTQATLSRDLEDIGARKSAGRYVLPGDVAPWSAPDSLARLTRLAAELLLAAEAAANLVVLRPPRGHSPVGFPRWPSAPTALTTDVRRRRLPSTRSETRDRT